jgi:hypothetical protein
MNNTNKYWKRSKYKQKSNNQLWTSNDAIFTQRLEE